MNPLQLHRDLTAAYRRFVLSAQKFKNPEIERWVDERIDVRQFLWQEPLVTMRRRFASGDSLQDLVDRGVLDPVVLDAFRVDAHDPASPLIAPYRHQTDAIDRLCGDPPENVIVATGTGSGKSFAFSIPIVSEAKRAKADGERGVKAVLVYPMNALANSQYEEFASRLHGTGLTVANYTGDLPRQYDTALKQFRKETGRDEPWDSEVLCREHVQENGVDILLTNYVMLELILTRWEDRTIFPFEQLGNLRFLVLDEVHTYTGRQGADVACLIRRLKEHTGTTGRLRCIGTSATVDSDAGEAAARATIAQFATDLFGEPFGPDNVITEQYAAHLTPETPDEPPATVGVTAAQLEAAARQQPGAVEALAESLTDTTAPDGLRIARHPAVAFLEREATAEIRAWPDLVAAYRGAWRPDASEEEAACELEAALVCGNAYKVEFDGEAIPVLVPKVHTFLSQGRPITGTLTWDLSDRGETHIVVDDIDLPAFPIVFCTACGAEALSATLHQTEAGSVWRPADFNAADIEGQAGYLFPGHWDRAVAPPDERRIKKDGTARKGWEGAVPQDVIVREDGTLSDGASGHDFAWVPEPLFLCPACGVQYTRRTSEYQKFFQAGTVGRATATDVLLGEVLQLLPAGTVTTKRSIIGFCDNRQDTAFQAAHANDFQRRIHFRRALYTALVDRGAVDDPALAVPARKLGAVVFDVMEGANALPNYSQVPEVTVGPGAGAKKNDYKRYLGFGVLADLVGRTRFRNNQTLQDVAAISIVYSGLAELAADESLWSVFSGMDSADAALRADVLRALLDTLRIAGAINSDPFSRGDEFREDVISRIADEALFHDPTLPPARPTVFSDDIVYDNRDVNVRRLTFRDDAPKDQGLVRWVRSLFGHLHDRDDAKSFIEGVLDVLVSAGLVVQESKAGGTAWRLNEDAVLVLARTDSTGRRCPKCRTRWEFHADRSCPQCAVSTLRTEMHDWVGDYVRNEYLTPIGEREMLVAEEHSAQVSGGERKEAESRFKDPADKLNTLICTPTMELGIDIGGLSAVYLRNVPPSPANYAQRQGRAGRHGQPAHVTTFCGTAGKFGSHDQYFYRFPERIVAGQVSPPRFLLENEDLLEAHLNSLTLEYLDFKIPSTPEEFIDFTSDDITFVADVVTEIRLKLKKRKDEIVDHAWKALGAELGSLHRDHMWVDRHVGGFADRYREAWSPMMDEYGVLREELHQLQIAQERGDLSRETALRIDSLLRRMQDIREGRSDFYPYRYLSSQGFLPNYAFPRRASSVFFNDRKESIARHRVTALREFAPEMSVYYRGARYRVEKAQPRARGGQTNWVPVKRCSCGWYFAGDEVVRSAVCPNCHENLTGQFASQLGLEIPDMVARRRGRISSDEDERRRRGFEIEPAYRLAPTAVTGPLATQASGEELGTVTYGPGTRLLVLNRGPRRRHGEPLGFRMCERCRRWILSESDEEDHVSEDNPSGGCPAGGAVEDIRNGIVLLAEGRHDAVTLDVDVPAGADRSAFAKSLAFALLDGFAVAYSAGESEVMSYVFGLDGDGPVRILIYEREEGGVGLLSHLTEAGAWRRIAIRALELMHVDPHTGANVEGACDRACYECLLSFYNQFDHEILDRTLVTDLLLQIAGGVTLDLTGPDELWERFRTNAEGSEGDVLLRLRERGCPPPTGQHKVIKSADGVPVGEADLVWPGKILVFIDGDVHSWTHVQNHDRNVRTKLKGLGYKIVEIDTAGDPEPGIMNLLNRLGVATSEPRGMGGESGAGEADGDMLESLPELDLAEEKDITPYDGWVPVFDVHSTADLVERKRPRGWIACDEDTEEGWFAVQAPGNSLAPSILRGGVLLLEPLDGEEPGDGETVLADLGEQIDPDTGTTVSLRAWWPEREGDEMTGLMLKARPSSGVEPIGAKEPASVRPIGRFLGEIGL